MVLNERVELAEQKAIVGVDFARVVKVDNHIHASCCMTQSHLFEFIKTKLKSSRDLVVIKNYKNTNSGATLGQIFQDLGLKEDELNLDQLGMRAVG